MRPRLWLLTTISTIVLLTAGIVAANVSMDIYGLYGPTRGRRLTVVGDARVAKYLLSMRYVPENFNAVLNGASVAANWDVTGIEKLRVYNESLVGGNIVEEKAVIEAALEKPGISAAFLLVHPALTLTHGFQTVQMNPGLKWSGLGSMSLWQAYKDMANIRVGRIPRTFDHAGTETYFIKRSEMNVHMKRMWSAPDFTIDAEALKAYISLVANLRGRGVRIIFIVPPSSEELLRNKRLQLERYVKRMRAEIGEGDLWIDFMAPELAEFCKPSNFTDGVHLLPDAAKRLVAHINTAVNGWAAEGQIRIAGR